MTKGRGRGMWFWFHVDMQGGLHSSEAVLPFVELWELGAYRSTNTKRAYKFWNRDSLEVIIT